MKSWITPFALVVAVSLTCACAHKSVEETPSSGGNEMPNNPLIPASFGPNYKYSELMIKDYDEMLAMVQALVSKAHNATSKTDTGGEGEAVEYLGRAVKLIISRPDSDNMVAKLLNEVRRDLQGFNSYEDTLAALANEALRTMGNSEASVNAQSTALVELENILGEIRPQVQNGNKEMKRIMVRIRDAHIRPSDEVKKDRRMRGMFSTKNPSDEAAKILKPLEPKQK